MLTLLAAGDWRSDQVRSVYDGASRHIVPEIESLIEAAWQKTLSRPGVKLFDGPMVRLDRFIDTPEQLELHLGQTSYKPFVGTNMAHPELADTFGRDVMANPVGVSPLLLTADGYILLGHRHETLAYYPGRIHPFAGSMDPNDASPFAAIRRELAEELSLTDAEVPDVRCTGIVEDHRLRQWELIFAADCLKTRDQLIAAVDLEEHHDTWSIPATAGAIAAALVDEPRLTPVACATMLLWGRLEFGEEWLKNHMQKIAQAV